ncbi:28843_t:CDS:2, partial [Dentiscutata erythropus]
MSVTSSNSGLQELYKKKETIELNNSTHPKKINETDLVMSVKNNRAKSFGYQDRKLAARIDKETLDLL